MNPARTLRSWVFTVGFIASTIVTAYGQDPDQAFDFWLSQYFLRSVAQNRGLFYPMRLRMEHRTGSVHDLKGDCELHIAAKASGAQRFWPKGIVVEPPNLCKEWPPAISDGNETALRNAAWPQYLDQNAMNRAPSTRTAPAGPLRPRRRARRWTKRI